MKYRLNLLPKEAGQIRKTNVLIGKVKLLTIGILALGIAIVAGVFGWLFYSQFELNQTKTAVEELTVELDSRAEEELKLRYYQQVLNSSAAIIASRKDYRVILNQLYSLVPASVLVETVSFGEEDVMAISGRARGVQSFRELLKNFETKDAGRHSWLGKVNVKSAQRLPDGIYLFRMEINLNKNV